VNIAEGIRGEEWNLYSTLFPIVELFIQNAPYELTDVNNNGSQYKLTSVKNNEIALILADSYKIVHDGLGALRLKLGEDLGLIDKDAFKFLWVVDFPMFEWSEEENRYKAQHHPFTSIKTEDKHHFSVCLFDIYKLLPSKKAGTFLKTIFQ